MSEEAIQALTEKRAALIHPIRELQSQLFHIDGAIQALGGRPAKKQKRLFGPGELIRLIGEAERSGMKAPREVAANIMKAKNLDQTDKALVRRIAGASRTVGSGWRLGALRGSWKSYPDHANTKRNPDRISQRPRHKKVSARLIDSVAH
jgi:hypothetical protein